MEIKEQRQRIRQTKEVNRGDEIDLIFDSIPAWIFYKNLENYFIKVNKPFCLAIGKKKNELEGRSLYDIFPREVAEGYFLDDLEVIKSKKPKRNIIESMPSLGCEVWIQTDKIPLMDDENNVTGVVGFSIDITKRIELEKKLKTRVEDAEKINEIMVDRELKMIELKKSISKIKKEIQNVSKK